MTWNREEALRLAGALRYAIGCATDSQAMWDAASHLESAVAEIDRRDRIEAGRERLTDTIDKLTAERDKLIVVIEESCLGYRSLVSDRNQWRSDYETLAANRDREISTLTAELDQLRSEGAARMDATEELLRARIVELEGRLARQEQWLRWPHHDLHEPVSKVYAKHFPDGDLRRIRDRFHAVIDKLTKELDAALARVKELEMIWDKQAALIRHLESEAIKETMATHKLAEDHERQGMDLAFHRRLGSDLAAIIRAIYPVYRAAKWWDRARLLRVVVEEIKANAALSTALDTARAALTPDLVAAIKAAGVEEP